MVRLSLLCGFLVSLFAAISLGREEPTASKPSVNPAFEKMKKLAGTWMVADKDGKPTDQVASIVKVTAGGSAIHETLFPGQDMEMISVYTVDGSDMIMTHYCVLGNQPRMKGRLNPSGNQVEFQFVGGGNLNPAKDKHMHASVLTWINEDQIEIQGTGWENGAPAKEMCCGMKLARKK